MALAALTALAIQAAGAPIIVTTPPVFRANATMETAQIADIQVSVAADGRTLWQGTLRVGGSQSANFSQNLNQAGEIVTCDNGTRAGMRRDSLQVSINNGYRNPQQPDLFNVSVTWVRSAGQSSCGNYESPTRTTGLTDTAVLSGAGPVQLKGDGGLVVTLRRLDR